eukprot:COSAG02_NODE_1035_length_15053_cov_60.180019_3_plen_54_part_00
MVWLRQNTPFPYDLLVASLDPFIAKTIGDNMSRLEVFRSRHLTSLVPLAVLPL